jgi:hypothetical protein
LENVTAILLSNTGAGVTVENFYEVQQEVHNPMVIFMEKGTDKVIKYFRIAAETMNELNSMFKLKYFDTPDLPEGRYQKFGGGYFVGCGPCQDETKVNKKARTAATVQAS